MLGWAGLALGTVHCALGLAGGAMNAATLWFVGSGLAIVCAASSNLAFTGGEIRALRWIAFQNGLLAAFFAAALSVSPAPPLAPTLAGALIFTGLTVPALAQLRWPIVQP